MVNGVSIHNFVVTIVPPQLLTVDYSYYMLL